MTDNVNITPGTGTPIATDDIGGVQYQRIKNTWGPDGTANDVDTASGKAFPVQIRESDGTDIAIGGKLGALTETAPATDTASSGLNGRLQRIAQRLTSLIGVFPATIDTNSGSKSASTLRVVLATDQPALTNKLLVTPDSVALPANQSVNVNQLAGTTPDTNSGSKSPGTLRVVLATDQPALTAKLLVTPDSVALPANQSVNVSQINAVTPLMGAGNTGTGSPRVTLATDQAAIASWGKGATGSAVPSGAQYGGANAITVLPAAATAGNMTGISSDKFGRQVVVPVTVRDLVGTQTTTLSASTSETTIVTAAASVFNDVVMFIVSNTSASTNTRIDFRDTTGGTVLFSIQSNGGQPPVGFVLPVPIPQTSINTNWTAQCATSTIDVRIYAVFVKNR